MFWGRGAGEGGGGHEAGFLCGSTTQLVMLSFSVFVLFLLCLFSLSFSLSLIILFKNNLECHNSSTLSLLVPSQVHHHSFDGFITHMYDYTMYCEVVSHPPAPLHEGQWPK